MKRMKLAFAIAAVLIYGSLQCVASCAFLETAPPCHHQSHDHHTVSACSHEIVMDRAQEIVSAVPVIPPVAAAIGPGIAVFEAPLTAANYATPPQLVLRI